MDGGGWLKEVGWMRNISNAQHGIIMAAHTNNLWTYLPKIIFKYYGAKVWKPTEIRHTESIDNFKVKCKAYFMDKIKSDSYVKYDWSFR